MRHCPQCGREYGEDDSFCVEDGATLTVGHVSRDVPTQIISSPAHARSDGVGSRGPALFLLLGVMGTVIVALGATVYFLTREDSATTAEPVANIRAAETKTATNVPREIRTIAEADVRTLLDRWKASQNNKDFAAYAALYSPSFVGYKDTPTGPVRRQSYAEWIADRRGMVKNFIGVEVVDDRITVDGEQAVITFTQRWRSKNLCDVGTKEITLRMFADGPRIVSEILRNSQRCY